MRNNNPAQASKKDGLVITHVFDTPVELVWKAWTDPERMKRWWGPKNFTSPFCKIDFRVGGKYLYCMRSPECQDFGAQASIAKSFHWSGLSAPIALPMRKATWCPPPTTV